MEILEEIPCQITTEQVLREAHLADADAEISRQVQQLAEAACQVARPKALYKVLYVGDKTDETVTIGGTLFASRVLRTNLEQVERVFPCVATCGRELDDLLPTGSDMMLGYCLDIIKEMALRAALGYLSEHLKAKYALGQTSTMNPGSLQDWPITEQHKLFSLLGSVEDLVGVRLTGSCLMIPLKSVSGIIFPTEVKFESCQLCPRPDCPNRRSSYAPELAKRYGVVG